MSDLISKSSLISYIDEQIEDSKEERSAVKKKEEASAIYFYSGEISVAKRIKRHVNMFAPAVDAVPVVHARWVKAHGMMPPEYHHRKQCDMCGGWALQDYFGRERLSHYCPACGAKMDAKEE